MRIDDLTKKCIESGELSRDDILYLLNLDNSEDIDKLLWAGDAVRKRCCGREIHIRALVEFTNVCARKCNYCGIRASNSSVSRYRMQPDEIIALAKELDEKDLKTVVLQSGEDPFYTGDMIAHIVSGIKKNTDVAVTLCVGERPYEDYKLWREAGADRYLLRHETANPGLYASLHPDGSFDNRMRCLRWLKELGFQTGAGAMVGSPGQTVEHLADDIEFYRDFQPDMIGVGPFISHPDTPYGECKSGDLITSLKMVALARIVARDSLIPATTAIGSIEGDGRERAFAAGADVVMINYTPIKYRVNYEIYPNKRCIVEEPDMTLAKTKERIIALGREVSTHPGHSRKSVCEV